MTDDPKAVPIDPYPLHFKGCPAAPSSTKLDRCTCDDYAVRARASSLPAVPANLKQAIDEIIQCAKDTMAVPTVRDIDLRIARADRLSQLRSHLENLFLEQQREIERLKATPASRDRVSGEERIRAYRPGSFGELPLPSCIHVAVVLNDYHIRNLRWLLRHAWHGCAPEHLNTGDWCGEILWALEQAMIESGLTGDRSHANGPDGGWLLDGFRQPEFHTKLRAHLETLEDSNV